MSDPITLDWWCGDAHEAGRTAGLDHLPREVPVRWWPQKEEWFRGYDYGIEQYDRIAKERSFDIAPGARRK